MNALPAENRVYRPWLYYRAEQRKAFCLCCIFPEKSELLREKGKDYFWTSAKKVRDVNQLMRFLQVHWRCGHHRWEPSWPSWQVLLLGVPDED